jgi:arylsulfatase A-like enzyme
MKKVPLDPLSTHGYHTGERQWWNKNTLFERSCRAPLIIAAPGMRGGQTTRSLAEFVDVYPTVADYCGFALPTSAAGTAAGTSLRPVLMKPDTLVKDAAFTLVCRGPKLYAQSVRDDKWRFTRWSDGQTELYDHDHDHEEVNNVAESHPEVTKALAKRLDGIGKPN